MLLTIRFVFCCLCGGLLFVLHYRSVQGIHIDLHSNGWRYNLAPARVEDAPRQRTPMVRVLALSNRSRRASSRMVLAAFMRLPPVEARKLVVAIIAGGAAQGTVNSGGATPRRSPSA